MENYYQKEKFFSEIYDQYIDKIYRFVFLKVDSQASAQDISSETFVRFWQQIYQEKEIKNPSAFLFKTARNLLVDFYRKKGNSPAPLDVLPQQKDPQPTPEESFFIKNNLKKVQDALFALDHPYRQALFLYYIEDEPIAKIAQTIDKSEGATRTIIHRGLKKLKKSLEA